jgi:CheY-like chemotaxis protein
MSESTADPNLARGAAAPTSVPAPANRPAQILVADDEDGTLALITAALTYAGFAVVTARDGLEAFARARESAPDLVMLDVMMPGMDGREVCRRMGADPALAHVPVILQSAADERDIDWHACGAVAFLAKPFKVRELPDLVRRHLASHARPDGPRPHRLTDDEIRMLAQEILRAARQRPDHNIRDSILSTHRELNSEDEARVEAALVALLHVTDEAPAGEERSADAAAGHGTEQRGEDATEE